MQKEEKQAGQPRNPKSQASLVWLGSTKSEAWVRGRHGPLRVDEPEVVGGEDTGPRPTEYVTVGYLGCVAVMIHKIAEEMNVEYSALKVDAQAEVMPYKDDPRRLGIGRFLADIHITTDEPIDKVDAVKDELDRRCIVTNMLRRSGAEMLVNWHVFSSSK